MKSLEYTSRRYLLRGSKPRGRLGTGRYPSRTDRAEQRRESFQPHRDRGGYHQPAVQSKAADTHTAARRYIGSVKGQRRAARAGANHR